MEKLDYIDQILAEFHLGVAGSAEEWGKLEIIRSLMTKFVPVIYHMNNWGCKSPDRALKSGALEVTLINKKLITLKSNSRSYAQNRLSVINKADAPDCQPE